MKNCLFDKAQWNMGPAEDGLTEEDRAERKIGATEDCLSRNTELNRRWAIEGGRAQWKTSSTEDGLLRLTDLSRRQALWKIGSTEDGSMEDRTQQKT